MKRKCFLTALCCCVFAFSLVGGVAACDYNDEKSYKEIGVEKGQNDGLLKQVLLAEKSEGLYNSATALSSQLSWSEIGLQDEYSFNQTLTIMERMVNIDGKDVACTSYVIYPDGNGTLSTSVKLNQSGQYELRYALVVNGTPYLAVETFTVKHQTYYVQSEKSTLEYGTNAYSQKEGLNVRLANGDALRLSKVVNN